MQKILLLAVFSILFLALGAQGNKDEKPLPLDPTKMSMADMQRLAKMTPAEQAAYKEKMLKNAEAQLKQKASALNMTIDETILPSYQLKMPVKDIKRLATIPAAPPTLPQLLQQAAKMETALKSSVGPQVVQKVEDFAASRSTKEIQAAAVGGWYDSNPEAALLLGMKAARKDPSNVLGWNNLAAIMNMAGLEDQAVPILKHCLVEKPNSSIAMNNIGQSYLGLGDLATAKQYFQQCLSVDELNPEANHSMGLLFLYDNDVENALKHFERELKVAQRRSSLAQLVKSGHRNRINLAALRKQKMKLDGTNEKDFFEEINLNKFIIPDPPANSKESAAWRAEHAGLQKSISEEMMFWMQAGHPTKEELEADGRKHFGIYHDLVNELIRDLGEQYHHLLGIIREDDVPFLQQLVNDYAKRDHETVCPQPPMDPGNTALTFAAYEKKCCDLKTPLIDELMSKYNSFISARIKSAQSNYKQYLNGLINAVQLDPSLANKRLVYATVSNYFTFLATAINSYKVLDPYMTCKDGLTAEEADEIIKSSRNVELKCPSWLKLNVSLKVAKLKADCEGYNIEADVYKLIQVGGTKKFSTGTSTLYVGAGIDGNFKGVASGSITQQFYVVFDNNNEFADLGMRGSASGDLAGGMIGAEFEYDIAMNSGFNAQGKVKSDWITKYEKALQYVNK